MPPPIFCLTVSCFCAIMLVANRHLISCKYARKCMISYVKYPNFPGGNTPDPVAGGRPILAPTPAEGSKHPRPGRRSSAHAPNVEHNWRPCMRRANSAVWRTCRVLIAKWIEWSNNEKLLLQFRQNVGRRRWMTVTCKWCHHPSSTMRHWLPWLCLCLFYAYFNVLLICLQIYEYEYIWGTPRAGCPQDTVMWPRFPRKTSSLSHQV